jgi:arabinan endo-1,5-alpha-L-arabinosidase
VSSVAARKESFFYSNIMWSINAFAALSLLLQPLVYGYADPLSCSGTCTNAHDPSVIRRSSDGTYFRFSTGNKIAIHTAPSVSGPWTYQCAMLPSGSSINLAGNQDLWAPDVSLVSFGENTTAVEDFANS